jgi:hypothetical protein
MFLASVFMNHDESYMSLRVTHELGATLKTEHAVFVNELVVSYRHQLAEFLGRDGEQFVAAMFNLDLVASIVILPGIRIENCWRDLNSLRL